MRKRTRFGTPCRFWKGGVAEVGAMIDGTWEYLPDTPANWGILEAKVAEGRKAEAKRKAAARAFPVRS